MSRERFNTLPYRYEQFDMALAWELRRSENETVVDGILKNLRYAFMEGIELWVAAAGPDGSVRARAVCYITPHQLRQDELAPFAVKLPLLIEPGDILQFTYCYSGSDGGDGGSKWTQSFNTTIASEAVAPPQ
ncbi:hypothetical protein [Geomonas sp. Red32]|uniref:hypothetical protein n=1 Tax=Geomonas sp. Red32 TaxID=2912856 RepID=UPI00202CF892